MKLPKETGERMSSGEPGSPYEKAIQQRLLFGYSYAAGLLAAADSVLEIGCADGHGTSLLAKRAAAVTAIDNDLEAVNYARASHGAPNIKFAHAAGETLDFPENSFDKAVALQVLEHIADDGAFLAGVARVLKPGGKLLLTTPNRTHRLAPGERPWYRFHVREYSADQLRALLGRHFGRVDIQFINVPPALFEMELRVARTASLIRKLDPLRLGDRIPYCVKKQVIRLLGLLPGRGRAQEAAVPAQTDFRVSQDDATALDLVAICEK